MEYSQTSLAFRTYNQSNEMEKSAMLQAGLGLGKSLLGGVWNAGKTVAQHPGSFLKGLGNRTADSLSRTMDGGKRFMGAVAPTTRNGMQRTGDAMLTTRQNFSGGMSSYGKGALPGNFVNDKLHIRDFYRGGGTSPVNASNEFKTWMQGLNPHQTERLMAHAGKPVGAAVKSYARDVYAPQLRHLPGAQGTQAFNNLYKTFGKAPVSQAAHTAENYGNRLGNFVGPAAITAPLVFAPYTMSGWAGAASAGDEASQVAQQAARRAVGGQMANFENMPMLQRFKMMWDPQNNIRQMYNNGDPSAVAHHYMYGAGRGSNIQAPGLFQHLKHLAMPFFTEDPMMRTMQSRAVSGLQHAVPQTMSKFGMEKESMMQAVKSFAPKVLGAFKSPGSMLKGTAGTVQSLARPGNVGGRMAVGAGVGGVGNVMAGDDNSNAFSRFAVGAGLGAFGGRALNKPMQQGFSALNKSIGRPMVNLGNQSHNVFNSSMRNLAKKALPGSGNSPGMQNLYGTAYKMRRHPFLTAGAGLVPYGMYSSYQEGKNQALGAAEEAGYAGGNAMAAQTIADQGFIPRMLAALAPSMAAGQMQQADPEAYNQYLMSKGVAMQNKGMPFYAR